MRAKLRNWMRAAARQLPVFAVAKRVQIPHSNFTISH